ncbi:superoxide dismutase family protein [Sulfitobacter sp.]|uniref:superoxide dismutase family protein n=1 Tax=Roseobacteraceae TaxID=2854170 RepID=UPI00329A20AB
MDKRFIKLLATCAVVSAGTPLVAETHENAEIATAQLVGLDGDKIGTATLTQGSGGVLIHVKVEGLTPGKHGLHLHAIGECAGDHGFKSAKGHVGLIEGGHGLLNPEGPEPGDLPNIFVGSDGEGEMEAFTTFVSLVGGDNNLLDVDGSSLLIHEGPDDHRSQPIGGSGGRVACGTIAKAG